MAAATPASVIVQRRLLIRQSGPWRCSLRLLFPPGGQCYHAAARRPRSLAPLAQPPPLCSRHLPFPPPTRPSRLLSTLASELGSEEEVEEVKHWRSSFTRDSIPYRSFDIHHARSSGAGGQNVNKVNTKVDMRFVLDDAKWLPALVKAVLKKTEARRINSSGEFVMTSERHRTQESNLTDCIDKVYDCVVEAAKLDGVTSPETKKRIAGLKVKQNERRLQEKKMRSSRRESRGRGDYG